MTVQNHSRDLSDELAKNPVLSRMRTVAWHGVWASPLLFFVIAYGLFHRHGEIPQTGGYLVLLICSLMFLYSVRTTMKWMRPPANYLTQSNSLRVLAKYIGNARSRVRVLAGCLDDEIFTDKYISGAFESALRNGAKVEIVWGSPHETRRYPNGSHPPAVLSLEWAWDVTFFQLPFHTNHRVLLIDRHIYRYSREPCRHDATGRRSPEWEGKDLEGLLVFNEELGYIWCALLFWHYQRHATAIQPIQRPR